MSHQPSTERINFVYLGWDGYNRSLIEAIRPLTAEQLAFRATAEMSSVGELGWHIANGRIDWFRRLDALGCVELDAERKSAAQPMEAGAIVEWLERTWAMVAATLDQWTVHDLAETYRHPYQGKVYAVTRQWMIWRIMAHDIHHGGQLSELLAMQGLFPLELTLLGGHLTEPEVVGD